MEVGALPGAGASAEVVVELPAREAVVAPAAAVPRRPPSSPGAGPWIIGGAGLAGIVAAGVLGAVR